VARATGIPAEQIRRIAAEMAHVAFKEEVVLDRHGRTPGGASMTR
jgi:anaerobic selenocysteine-containing dehydrogenase